jgi:NTE family protein
MRKTLCLMLLLLGALFGLKDTYAQVNSTFRPFKTGVQNSFIQGQPLNQELTSRRIVIMHQRYNQGVNLGLNPVEDSASLARINAKMDSIRHHRPTVGLVLSGGGAKGAAHVGVIKYLESIDMPVDLVVGTSMGGLIGGLYSLGYDSAQMDSIVRNINWDLALSDRIPREHIPYSEIRNKERYLISFPFYYQDVMTDSSDVHYATDNKPIKMDIGAEDSALPGKTLKDKLMASIPSGFVYGHNVNDLLKGLSVGYHDSLDFNNLPIPYACIATDLVSGKGKVWHSGHLPVAMRSTMAIPGIFAPVKIDDMVLVDGGMRDNYPTDLAKRMGADIVIGVDLSSGFGEYKDINNLLDIMSAGIDMMGREAYELNVNIPDVSIKPDLKGYGMMSFTSESVSDIIVRGYEAAVANAEGLARLKKIVGSAGRTLNNTPAVDITSKPVYISSIDVKGVTEKEEAILKKKIGIHEGEMISRSQIEEAEAIMMGTRAYEHVGYNLIRDLASEDEAYKLVFSCARGPIHKVGAGIRFDTEELVSALVNFGFNTQKLAGSRYDVEIKFNANPYLRFVYSYESPKTPTFNIATKTKWTDMRILDFSRGARLNLSYLNINQELYLSNIKWNFFDVNLGVRNDVWYFPTNISQSPMIDPAYCTEHRWTDYISAFLDGSVNTFNDGYFPTRGVRANISYSWLFGGFPSHDFSNIHRAMIHVKGASSIGNLFTFLPSLDMGLIHGKEIPFVYGNYIGGSFRGRYVSSQIPFIGLNGLASLKPFYTVLRTDYRFRLAPNHYLTGMVNYARDCTIAEEFFSQKLGYFGAGIEYAYDTIVGPFSIDVHWSNLSPTKNKFGFYINLGYHF